MIKRSMMEEKIIESRQLDPSAKKEMRKRSFYYSLVSLIFTFCLICLYVFSPRLQDADSSLLKSIQSWFPTTMYSNSFFQFCTDLFRYYTELHILNGVFCFLYCAFHPFITFKIALLANMSILIHTIAVLFIYRDPKPYWAYKGIHSYECHAVFTGPAYNQLMATLVVFYTITMVKRYGAVSGKVKGILLIGFFCLLNVLTLVFSVLNAENFVYQNLLGILIAVVIVIAGNLFDREISTITLKVAFIIRGSKKYKFLLMVVLLLIFSTCLAFTVGMDEIALIRPSWIQNHMIACPHAATNIINAYNEAKIHLTSTIYVLGMTFGASFSNERLPLYWWETTTSKRMVRGVISLIVYIGTMQLFSLIPYTEFETRFAFHFVVPITLASLVCYGVLPFVYQKLNWNKGNSEEY